MASMCSFFGTPSVAAARFEVVDEILGEGSPDALRMKTLRNRERGESFSIVWESGGKTEALRLRSARGHLRDVLQTHGGNATAVRLATHYAGSILLPFANRIANGTYSFFGQRHYLPRNECPPNVRCDALHGFLFNRTLAVVRQRTLLHGSWAASYRITTTPWHSPVP